MHNNFQKSVDKLLLWQYPVKKTKRVNNQLATKNSKRVSSSPDYTCSEIVVLKVTAKPGVNLCWIFHFRIPFF